ncbi:MAG: TonB family protein [Opitutaceae bacterium]
MSAEAVSPTSFRAFVLSSSLHAAIVVLALLAGWTASQEADVGKVIELVAGEGDNFSAREAPALGVPGGISVPVPAAPAPRPAPTPEPVVERAAPPEPVTPAPAPVPAPVAPPAPKTPVAKDAVKADDAPPNFKKKIDYAIVRGDAKAKQQIRKEREAEAKRVADEKKRMSKEEFDRAQKGKAPAGKSGAATKVARVDAEGIAKGVVGGSTANKSGGAGGKALKATGDDVLAAYDQYFKEELRRKFDPPPGLAETLKATFQVRSNPDGSLASPRVLKTSGSRQFDDAVLEAIRRMKMPARPDKKAETVEFTFSMRELSEG